MDGSRFDDLTRALAAGTSRRRILKGLIGGLAGLAGAAGLRSEGVEAQRRPNGSACTSSGQCASFKCADGVCCNTVCTGQCETCATGTCLPAPAGTQKSGNRPACTGTDVCQGSCDGVTRNHCTQYPGLDVVCNPTECDHGWLITYGCGGDGTCHPTTTNCAPFGCNAEGTACAASCAEVPDGGACPGGTCCGGVCVDTRNSLEHCGACNNACNATPTPGTCQGAPICQAGACTFAPLPAGTLCRESAGDCDVEERCNGTSIICPQNGFRPNSFQCRPSTGVCDPAEFCTGSSAACPPDAFQPNTFVCRAGGTGQNAICNPPEFCTGSSSDCPPNVFAAPGTPCEAGNLCTADTCNADGVCVQGPVTGQCPQPTICQDAVTCNPATGECVIDFSDPGTPCENPDLCLDGGACNGAGVCTGGAPVNCSELTDQCNVGTCNPDTGACFAQPTPDVACENPDPCLIGGACTAQGTCTGGTSVDCSAFTDQCNVGVCDPTSGQCIAQPTPDVACENPDLCVGGGTCTAEGTCAGGTPTDCSEFTDQCNDGVCNPDTGDCVAQPTPGVACENPDACITGGTCTAEGTCTGGTPVTCDQCQICDDGQCVADDLQDGSDCNDGNACTTGDICTNGVCAGTPVTCDQCQTCVGGSCLADPDQNGDTCNDGLFCTNPDTCLNGVCTGPPTCPTDQCFECDEENNICTGGCDNDRPLCCPGLNGHQNKCCPADDVCDYSPSGAVNCSSDNDPVPGECGGPCRPEGDACDAGLNCIGPKDGPVSLCAPSTSDQMCCASTGFIEEDIPEGGCPTDDTCYTQPNILGACGCFSAYKFVVSGQDDWRIECCDAGTDAPDGQNCEQCDAGICPA